MRIWRLKMTYSRNPYAGQYRILAYYCTLEQLRFMRDRWIKEGLIEHTAFEQIMKAIKAKEGIID